MRKGRAIDEQHVGGSAVGGWDILNAAEAMGFLPGVMFALVTVTLVLMLVDLNLGEEIH
jgi:hypothetical protein